jgi:hypothetical protein
MWCVFLPRMGMRWVVVPSNGGAHKIIVELIKVENDLGRNVGDLVELGGGQQRPLRFETDATAPLIGYPVVHVAYRWPRDRC